MSVPADSRKGPGGADGASGPRLALKGISKSFGAVEALTDVDLEIFPGEVVALVGDNGAGKSTLVKTIAGSHQADAGTIVFEGREVHLHSPSDATALGIETVYQDLALCDDLDIVQNMFLGRERTRRIVPTVVEPLSEIEMEQRGLDTLKRLSVTTIRNIRQPVAALSGGQRQAVAISRTVMWNSKVVLLDEPTAALGVAQTRNVLDLIKRLRQEGLSVVLISHNLSDVFEVADRIVVLRLGRNAGTFRCAETSPARVVEAITGADLQVAG